MKTKPKWHSVQEMLQVLLESWAHVSVLFLSIGVGTFCHWVLWVLLPSMVRNSYPKVLGLLSHQPHQQITQRFSPLATRAAFEISFCGYVSVARHDAAHLAILPLNRLRQEVETYQKFLFLTMILPLHQVVALPQCGIGEVSKRRTKSNLLGDRNRLSFPGGILQLLQNSSCLHLGTFLIQ